jgi:hypothetical protein
MLGELRREAIVGLASRGDRTMARATVTSIDGDDVRAIGRRRRRLRDRAVHRRGCRRARRPAPDRRSDQQRAAAEEQRSEGKSFRGSAHDGAVNETIDTVIDIHFQPPSPSGPSPDRPPRDRPKMPRHSKRLAPSPPGDLPAGGSRRQSGRQTPSCENAREVPSASRSQPWRRIRLRRRPPLPRIWSASARAGGSAVDVARPDDRPRPNHSDFVQIAATRQSSVHLADCCRLDARK